MKREMGAKRVQRKQSWNRESLTDNGAFHIVLFVIVNNSYMERLMLLAKQKGIHTVGLITKPISVFF